MRFHLISAFSATLAASLAVAGPLTPPVGPPSSTDKTLVEVEPRVVINDANTPGDADSRFRITESGSYYLTRTTGVAGIRHGIEIAADDVTIDLMGFTLFSADPLPIGSPPISLNGITIEPGMPGDNITIRNGVVRGFGQHGVALSGGRNCRLEDLLLFENKFNGAILNLGTTVTNCQAWLNEFDGFNASSGYGTFIDCAAVGNGLDGFDMDRSSVVVGCNAQGNGDAGFRANSGTRIADCVARSNAIGYDVGVACVVTGCVSAFNGTGFSAGASGTLQATVISGCVAHEGVTGYSIEGLCHLIDNIANDCGTTGILVDGVGNRVEGNHVTGPSATGFEVTGAGNLLIRNTSRGVTTDYVIVPGNRYGPILNISAGGTPGVAGPAAASTLGTADPWANFSY